MTNEHTDTTEMPMTSDITRFITDLYNEQVAEKTIVAYRSDLALFAAWFEQTNGEVLTADAITPTDLRDYKAYLQVSRKHKPATINRKLSALKKFGAWAQARGLIRENPTAAVKSVAAAERAPKSLTPREVDRIIREAERRGRKRDIAILLTLRHTGIRVSELCRLQLTDVTIGERSGLLVVRSGKGRTYREIPLNIDVRKALTGYLAVRPLSSDPTLFLSQEKRGIATNTVWALVTAYARRAGIEASPHTLRHSFATALLRQGTDLVAVGRLLGHTRLDTTAIYTQPSARDLAAAVATLASDQEAER